MANHKHQHLNPAYGLIRKFCGGSGKLRDGIDAVAKVTGAHPSRVYRWMYPVDNGGTGGYIPEPQMRKLVEYARNEGMPLSLDDFFNAAEAA